MSTARKPNRIQADTAPVIMPAQVGTPALTQVNRSGEQPGEPSTRSRVNRRRHRLPDPILTVLLYHQMLTGRSTPVPENLGCCVHPNCNGHG